MPDSLQASGQTLIGLVDYGAAKFAANFFGGRLNHTIGYEGCMLTVGLMAGAAALAVGFVWHCQARKRKMSTV